MKENLLYVYCILIKFYVEVKFLCYTHYLILTECQLYQGKTTASIPSLDVIFY